MKCCIKDFPIGINNVSTDVHCVIGNPTNISNLEGGKNYWTEWKPECTKYKGLTLQIWKTCGGLCLGTGFNGPSESTQMNSKELFLMILLHWQKNLHSKLGKQQNILELYSLITLQLVLKITHQKLLPSIFTTKPSKPWVGTWMTLKRTCPNLLFLAVLVTLSFSLLVARQEVSRFIVTSYKEDIKPRALFIKSGDVVIMSGHARLCYHGVARVIEGSAPSFLTSDHENWDADCATFMAEGRINMNVRQVKIKNNNT